MKTFKNFVLDEATFMTTAALLLRINKREIMLTPLFALH
jgi:hypothetical protein